MARVRYDDAVVASERSQPHVEHDLARALGPSTRLFGLLEADLVAADVEEKRTDLGADGIHGAIEAVAGGDGGIGNVDDGGA